MIGEDDDFIPHHMYQLEVSCCSPLSCSCSRASPLSIYQGSIHKVSQAPEAVGDYGCEDAIHLSNHPSSLFKPHCQVDVTLGEVLVTLWIWVQPTLPRIHPSRAFFVLVCHTATMLSVCKDHTIPVYLCLSWWLERVQVALWTRACICHTNHRTKERCQKLIIALKKDNLGVKNYSLKAENKTLLSCYLQ